MTSFYEFWGKSWIRQVFYEFWAKSWKRQVFMNFEELHFQLCYQYKSKCHKNQVWYKIHNSSLLHHSNCNQETWFHHCNNHHQLKIDDFQLHKFLEDDKCPFRDSMICIVIWQTAISSIIVVFSSISFIIAIIHPQWHRLKEVYL